MLASAAVRGNRACRVQAGLLLPSPQYSGERGRGRGVLVLGNSAPSPPTSTVRHGRCRAPPRACPGGGRVRNQIRLPRCCRPTWACPGGGWVCRSRPTWGSTGASPVGTTLFVAVLWLRTQPPPGQARWGAASNDSAEHYCRVTQARGGYDLPVANRAYASNPSTTLPYTSVSRKSRPA